MAESRRIALLGFLPWSDSARQIAVRENPSAIVADRCAIELMQGCRLILREVNKSPDIVRGDLRHDARRLVRLAPAREA